MPGTELGFDSLKMTKMESQSQGVAVRQHISSLGK